MTQLHHVGPAVVEAHLAAHGQHCARGHQLAALVAVVIHEDQVDIESTAFCPLCTPQHPDEHGQPVFVRVLAP